MRRLLIVPMAALLLGTPTLHAQAIAGPAPLPARSVEEAKSPTTARLIGIFPGAGHMYAGESGRGFAYLGGTAAIFVVGTMLMVADCTPELLSGTGAEDCGSPALENAVTVVALGFYGWSIYDAGRAARRTNARRGLRASLILAPVRSPVSSVRDGRAVRLGMSFATR
jgi:hypothetical protein